MNDLALVPTNELIDELKRRHDCFLLAMWKHDAGGRARGRYYIHTIGNNSVVMRGLRSKLGEATQSSIRLIEQDDEA